MSTDRSFQKCSLAQPSSFTIRCILSIFYSPRNWEVACENSHIPQCQAWNGGSLEDAISGFSLYDCFLYFTRSPHISPSFAILLLHTNGHSGPPISLYFFSISLCYVFSKPSLAMTVFIPQFPLFLHIPSPRVVSPDPHPSCAAHEHLDLVLAGGNQEAWKHLIFKWRWKLSQLYDILSCD